MERYRRQLGANHFILRLLWPGMPQKEALGSLELGGLRCSPRCGLWAVGANLCGEGAADLGPARGDPTRVALARAKVEKAVTGPTREGDGDTGARGGGQTIVGLFPGDGRQFDEQRARRRDGYPQPCRPRTIGANVYEARARPS